MENKTKQTLLKDTFKKLDNTLLHSLLSLPSGIDVLNKVLVKKGVPTLYDYFATKFGLWSKDMILKTHIDLYNKYLMQDHIKKDKLSIFSTCLEYKYSNIRLDLIYCTKEFDKDLQKFVINYYTKDRLLVMFHKYYEKQYLTFNSFCESKQLFTLQYYYDKYKHDFDFPLHVNYTKNIVDIFENDDSGNTFYMTDTLSTPFYEKLSKNKTFKIIKEYLDEFWKKEFETDPLFLIKKFNENYLK